MGGDIVQRRRVRIIASLIAFLKYIFILKFKNINILILKIEKQLSTV